MQCSHEVTSARRRNYIAIQIGGFLRRFAQRSEETSGRFWLNPGRRVFLARQSYATPQSTPAGQTCWSKIDFHGDLCEFGSRKEFSKESKSLISKGARPEGRKYRAQ